MKMVWIGNLGSSIMVPTTTSSVNIQQIDLCNIIVNNLPKHIMLGGSHIKRDKKSKSVIKKGKNIIWQKEGVVKLWLVYASLVFLKLVQTQINIFILLLYI
jgi:hypothetical protein